MSSSQSYGVGASPAGSVPVPTVTFPPSAADRSNLYAPVSLLEVLREPKTPAHARLLLLWAGSLVLSLVLGLATLEFGWTGIPVVLAGTTSYVTIYPPLIICTALTLWFGFWWGFIPAYLATFLLAAYSGMPLSWATLFAFADPLGLAVLALGFHAVPVSVHLRSLSVFLFYTFVTFIGGLAGSSGSFIWTYTNTAGFAQSFPIWQGWWMGAFLQGVIINGPIFLIFGPRVIRWKNPRFPRARWMVPPLRVIACNFGLVLLVLAGFMVGVYILNMTDLERTALLISDAAVADRVLSAAQGIGLIHWISLGLLAFTVFFGFQVANRWNLALRQSLEEQAGALRDSHRLLQSVMDGPNDAMFVKDLQGRYVFVNRAVETLYGRPREAILDRDDFALLPKETAETMARDDRQILGSGKAIAREETLTFGGQNLTFLTTRAPILGNDGRLIGLVGIAKNITERKESEQVLVRTNQRLEEVLAELRDAQATVIQQERLRALGEMASGVAHDFNNVLMQVMGLSEVARTHALPDGDLKEVESMLQQITESARDGAAVVKNLSEFYRDRSSSDIYSPVDPNAILHQVASVTQPLWKDEAQSRGIYIQVKEDTAEVPPIRANEPSLRSALTNLILNAIDALPQGGTISLKSRAQNGRVLLEVSDSGKGMSEEERVRCLEPFFTTKGPGGSGLGLAMVHGILKRHSADLEIESAPGKGSTFCLSFAAYHAEESTEDETPGHSEAPRPRRILVVDDEPVIATLISRSLSRAGHTVETAANGAEGLHRFREGTFDLVLSDQSMPGMTGEELAKAIKAEKPATKVVLLTGFGSRMKDRMEDTSLVDLILSKPVAPDDLLAALERLS